MPRGGKRAGAGRPRGSAVLDWYESLSISAKCEKHWREACEKNLSAAKDKFFAKSDYHALVAAFKAESLEDRKAYIPAIGSDGEARYLGYTGEQHHDDVEGAIRTMLGMDDADPSGALRCVSFAWKRPYGVQAQIVKDVARWATAEFNKPISSGIVRSAWKLMRSVRSDV